MFGVLDWFIGLNFCFGELIVSDVRFCVFLFVLLRLWVFCLGFFVCGCSDSCSLMGCFVWVVVGLCVVVCWFGFRCCFCCVTGSILGCCVVMCFVGGFFGRLSCLVLLWWCVFFKCVCVFCLGWLGFLVCVHFMWFGLFFFVLVVIIGGYGVLILCVLGISVCFSFFLECCFFSL